MIMTHRLFILMVLISVQVNGQHQRAVDFSRAEIAIAINSRKKALQGTVHYSMEVLENVDSVFLDARNMIFSSVLLNGKKVRFKNDNQRLVVQKKLKKGTSHELSLSYEAQPVQAVYFVGWDDALAGNNQIWTQGQGKYTSHWLPSLDDMEDKIEFDLQITFDPEYEVIANGTLKNEERNGSQRNWSFDMAHPMSSYLLAFAIGNYEKTEIKSESGIPIQLYYYPEDSLRVEPTYRHTKGIFDFLEREIGFPYPWQNYKQVPVRDFLYAGMENTGTTIFSDSYVIDSLAYIDKNYVTINAHELAHQWFGNLVTEKDSRHHWLHEGFATYYAYLAEKEIFGEEYFHWKLYESASTLRDLSEDGKGEALTNPDASSLTFYEKGAWALHMLRVRLGEEAFKKGMVAFLKKYQFQNATVQKFMLEMERAGATDLSEFERLWLREKEFPFEQASEYLKRSSESLRSYLELQWELTTSATKNETIIKKYWDRSTSDYLKKNIVARYHKSFSPGLLKTAFDTGDVEIRQALAIALREIPAGLEPEFGSLLQDKSYLTIEHALYTLWIHDPGGRERYLDQTKGIIGLPNKNVRMLWLLLAILTKDYSDPGTLAAYRKELMDYTAPSYPFEVRQNAFALISEVFPLPNQNLKDLVNATVHHSWQFRKFARALLDTIIAKEKGKERILKLTEQLNGEELRYINSKLQSE